MPLASFQDTGGPMCRTVQDCALMMDAMVGFDDGAYSNQRVSYELNARLINNEEEYKEVTGVPDTYTDSLDSNGLQGARIGVVRGMFSSDDSVNNVVNEALARMQAAGATVEDVVLPD